ncbi:MAG: tRNA (adenosine(37)-N6)-threonylcarbamoyltransferase complex ATPase subunit type 1 TsaE [Candidatus Woykebacteria bacterium RBG_16_44_10]|uniref:tRNA threonylcarbamoyladenosine biosynthesis protein TsaE n=1 Tax=Candidatus Woykebacteria bacterium RBG_16_44_10 TaxID=1802597 RepID=A0A1G1WCB2_9BACT|nr:MAG: tRNA (adenosine(37)-N6)-threonylcarbamoyltransferase complex ATPase subunit type 1 TsaE [Candidatus Woykebacteria bacterium RBG_16_44_10]
MEKVKTVFISKSAKSTQTFAKSLAKKIRPGDILALYGSLGAGKTTFVQGLAAGLGYKARVFSPTFIFVRPYKLANSKQQTANSNKRKIKILYHIDLYRVEKETDLKTIGIEEFLTDNDAVSVIEWPEKIENKLPIKTIKIKIEVISENERRIKVDG